MTDLAEHAGLWPLEHPRTIRLALRTAEFSDDAEVLDSLARSGVTSEVMRKIAHNPATAERTLEYLVELDERWMTYPVTRRRDVSAGFVDRIAQRLTDRNAIYHASSAPCADETTLRYLAGHPSAPAAAAETVDARLGDTIHPAA
ncbi:hypothetical protein BH708_03140 [Brachybacterium sp. P6-10-X1]|uniref:hypothetical protein n=1 Tax=Brachybacterium sp. P6-10-X1 TaxID=1903186 RepID=UPI000971A56B|nr:hypothetical protein [Brachybacterium sp. P6-10-X1]APX31884.1 hypothetical protein BH708_03140 [Brachybacterium sp. P6-10-X1]